MRDIEIEKMIENMNAAGCSRADADRVRQMHEAGMDSEILQVLKSCRCGLIDEIHGFQRKLDRMDRLIRNTERGGIIK